MAIQQIDLAVPNGDTVRSANVKINQNFTNTSHAASRLVGENSGNVMPVGAFGLGREQTSFISRIDKGFAELPNGFYMYSHGNGFPDMESTTTMFLMMKTWQNRRGCAMFIPNSASNDIIFRFFSGVANAPEDEITHTNVKLYTDRNTTIGTNKELVTSSPVVRVFSDTIEAIHEANDLPLEFIRNGEGDYTLKGTTGLRKGQNDWQIIIPKDEHDNQLIAFTLDEDADGTIQLKTYKRTFNMETFTFGPDLSTPLDIPAGRWVDLHFNDLPQTDDPITGV